jgi:hypothetical protein
VGMIALFPLRWPSMVRSLFSVTETASASGTSVMNLECETQQWTSTFASQFYFQAILTCSFPILCVALAAIFWSAVRRFSPSKQSYFTTSCLVILSTLHVMLIPCARCGFATKYWIWGENPLLYCQISARPFSKKRGMKIENK